LPASSTSRSEPPTGVQYRLDRDGQRAVVTEVGAGLRSWRVGGREQLDTFPLADAGDGYRGHGVTLWMDEGFRYVQVYTADTVLDPARRRGGIAIEPMTCAPDAFNSGEGLAVIEPGGSFSARWGLTATAPRKGDRWTGT
jgi:galactose mutarotase-like enzyme